MKAHPDLRDALEKQVRASMSGHQNTEDLYNTPEEEDEEETEEV